VEKNNHYRDQRQGPGKKNVRQEEEVNVSRKKKKKRARGRGSLKRGRRK